MCAFVWGVFGVRGCVWCVALGVWCVALGCGVCVWIIVRWGDWSYGPERSISHLLKIKFKADYDTSSLERHAASVDP